MSDTVSMQLERSRDEAIERTKDLLRIESVSTDPAYAVQIRSAADWAAAHLRDSGLSPQILPTDGHPLVHATTPDDRVADPNAPRVLFYGHYDVQPADPVEQWTSPPFEPTVRDGQLFARGACDDKGQVMTFLEALRAYHDAGEKLPCPVTVLLEGEEECASVNLANALERYRDQLAADVVLIADTDMWDARTPAITYALRGMLYFDIQLHGPNRDLHSGMYGGAIANPATRLTQILGGLFDGNHRVNIPGFYDDVQTLTREERTQWSQLEFDEDELLRSIGMSQPFGETGYTTLERRWARPACDINGLYGGYGGEGAKTIIPSHAGAKVSFRLAADQDPDKIGRAFRKWLEAHDTRGLRWQISELGRANPVAIPTDSPWLAATSRAVEQTAGLKPVLQRSGATIPVVAHFKRILGIESIMLGFGLASDKIHSPDEHFGLDRFELARKTHARLLRELAQT